VGLTPDPTALAGPEDVARSKVLSTRFTSVFAVREPGQYLRCLLWKALRRPSRQPEVARGALPAIGIASLTTLLRHFPETGCGAPRDTTASASSGGADRGPGDHPQTDYDVVVYPGGREVTPLGNYLLELTGGPAAAARRAAATA
jgi:hypothetical protein